MLALAGAPPLNCRKPLAMSRPAVPGYPLGGCSEIPKCLEDEKMSLWRHGMLRDGELVRHRPKAPRAKNSGKLEQTPRMSAHPMATTVRSAAGRALVEGAAGAHASRYGQRPRRAARRELGTAKGINGDQGHRAGISKHTAKLSRPSSKGY